MQKQELFTYRDHIFTYADHEREVMHVVTRLGHAYIGQERQWSIEEENDSVFYLIYLTAGQGCAMLAGQMVELGVRSTVTLPVRPGVTLSLKESEVYYARIEGRYPNWYVGEGIRTFGYQFSRYSEYFFYNLLANVDVYGEMYCAAAASIVYRWYSDLYFYEKSFVKKNKDRSMDAAVSYIETHYREEICVKEVARRSGYSEYHFNRKFKEIFGVTPYHYVTQRRLIEAKNLLLTSEDTNEKIAQRCGFQSAVSFYNAFKKEFKLTPNQYKSKKKIRDDGEKEWTKMKQEKFANMIQLVQRGKVAETDALIKECLADGVPAIEILNDALLVAMQQVADKWAAGKAFIPEVLIASRCLNSGLAILDPELTKNKPESKGKVIVGTVKTDLHNIGKNLVALMLKTKGFEVIDAGVDVGEDAFVAAVKEHQPKYICMSALLTTSMPYMKAVVDKLVAEGLRDSVKVCIGGAPVTQTYCEEIGADIYAESAVDLAEKLASL